MSITLISNIVQSFSIHPPIYVLRLGSGVSAKSTDCVRRPKSMLKGIGPCLSKYALIFTRSDMRIPLDLLPGQAELTLSVTTLSIVRECTFYEF